MNVDLKTLHESKNYDEIYNLIETKFSQFETRWNSVLASEEGVKLWRNTKLSNNNRDKIYRKMFAELSVRECAKYINERTQDWDANLRWIFNDGSGDMAVNVDELLNRHFGVEE